MRGIWKPVLECWVLKAEAARIKWSAAASAAFLMRNAKEIACS